MDAEIDVVRQLLTGVVPERRNEITALLERYEVGFHRGADTVGFKLENSYGQVIYNDRTLRQLYLVSFMAWRALRAYSGLIILLESRGLPFDLRGMADLHGQKHADEATDRLATTLAAIHDAWGLDDVSWPADVPMPTLDRHPDAEDQAAQEIALLATSYMLLHEVQHVMLSGDGTAPGGWQEELICDAFAQRFMLANVDQYARGSGEPAQAVLNKRAMGIALANAVLAEITPPDLWGGSSHPPVADRLAASYASWPTDGHASVWIYMACLLAARLRREGRIPDAITFRTPRQLCENLTRLVS